MQLYSYATSEMMIESDSGGQDRQFCRSGQFTEIAEIAESADQSFPVGQTSDCCPLHYEHGGQGHSSILVSDCITMVSLSVIGLNCGTSIDGKSQGSIRTLELISHSC